MGVAFFEPLRRKDRKGIAKMDVILLCGSSCRLWLNQSLPRLIF